MAFSDLSERFGTVVWAPGNHELWTHPDDKVQLRGEERYRHLVRLCRSLGVLTPEDPYPVRDGVDGPVTVAPLFVLYDYTFHPRAWCAPTSGCFTLIRSPAGRTGAGPASS
jgi:hypothetical protein